MNKISGIYKLEIGPYIYIGQSINCSNRIKQHKSSLNKNKHTNSYMQNVYNKYKQFKSSILFKLERQYLTVVEQVCINYYNKDYVLNINAAERIIRTEKWKAKVSLAHKASTKAKTAREKLYEKRRQEGLNPEHYKNVCIANAKRKGVPLSKETRIKMSKTRSSNPKLLEQARQLGLSMKGEANASYQFQEYIFRNIKNKDVYIGTRINFRNYLNKEPSYNGNLTKLIQGKQKTFFGYEITACMLPQGGNPE